MKSQDLHKYPQITYALIKRERFSFTVEKAGRQHLTQVSTVSNASSGPYLSGALGRAHSLWGVLPDRYLISVSV